jgi:hypothetical protein
MLLYNFFGFFCKAYTLEYCLERKYCAEKLLAVGRVLCFICDRGICERKGTT